MPLFKYRGYRTDGSTIDGSIEASGLTEAAARVRAEGIFPSEIAPSGIRDKKRAFWRRDEAFLSHTTRQLSTLLSAGVPLIEALQTLAAENSGFQREMLIAVREAVSGGLSLHKALEQFGTVFPEFYINMVHSGEQSGTLDRVLMSLADFLEGQQALRARVQTSLIYPVLMVSVSVLVLSFLFTFVIPKIVTIFRDTKASLPFITVLLISVSTVFVKYWWALAAAAAGIAFSLRRFVRTHRLEVDRFILTLPGSLIQSLYYARFARTLGFLLGGGLPMLKALALAARSVGNREIERVVVAAERKVAEGQSLSSALEGFPPVFIQLIATGEKSGKMSETLQRAVQSYEEDFNRKVTRVISLFEPAMIIVMGFVVLFIVLAVLLPLFQLNQLIK